MVKISDGLDYDSDTTDDFDETTFDGSEGLDGDFLTDDDENYVVDTPDRWRGVSPHDTLGEWLVEEKPDIGVGDDLGDDPGIRYSDVDGHEPFKLGSDGPHNPDHNRRMGWTTY